MKSVSQRLVHMREKFYVVCEVCKENLGDYRPFFAQKHLTKYSDHKEYSVKVKMQR